MQFSKVIGQQEAKQRLGTLIDEQRIPHALMFTGAEGCGKMAMALALASFLLGERWNGKSLLQTQGQISNSEAMLAKWGHPDLLFSYPVIKPKNSGGDHKTTSDDYAEQWRQMLADGPYFSMDQWMTMMDAEKQQAIIYEAESDRLAHKLNMKSSMGGYKVSLIWLPERMNQTCANKLLKLLEEPPQMTVFLLVSERPELLLETIRSRVQVFHMRQTSDDDIQQALIEQRGLEAGDARRIARTAAGNWLNALKEIDAGNEKHQFFEMFVTLMRNAYARNVKELKKWSDTAATLGREKQRRLLTYMLHMVRENFMYNFHNPDICYMTHDEEQFAKKFSSFINERNVVAMQMYLQRMIRDIGQNANAKIQFFNMTLEMVIYLRS